MHVNGDPPYCGRFAPSPTGPLHLGSLIAALASYLDARYNAGTWLVRMEDLDPPREEQGAARRILDSLQNHGLHWDGELLFQSQRHHAYAAALQKLSDAGHLFHCDCTRQSLGPDGACQGNCRDRRGELRSPTAIRVSSPSPAHIEFVDQLQPDRYSASSALPADFVVRRKDGLYAYQLAVVVDDEWQGVNHIVRGSDLMDSTARQICLQQLLGYRTPSYLHLPVITDRAGHKFSKQTHAPALDDRQAAANLRAALAFLHQREPPPALHTSGDILHFACQHWMPRAIPAVMSIPAG